jgi:putative ABC transport system substrate-binding protein
MVIAGAEGPKRGRSPVLDIGRREFITLIGGVAAAAPLAARAQQGERMRRIGVLISYSDDLQIRVSVFQQTLQQLGWTDGHNIRIEYRWTAGDADEVRRLAKELVRLDPDVIVCQTTPSVRALGQETHTIPIVFIQVTDPVRAGFVASMARPGGNVTGLSMYEPAMGAKWLEVLKEIAPDVARVALLFNPETAPGRGSFFLSSIEAAAPSLAVKPITTPVQDAAGIERAIAAFARESNGGLFVMPDLTTQFHRDLIIGLAARHQLPAVYSQRTFVLSGGLISYGVDTIHQFHLAATYVNRILRGEKPSNLPVQAPVKFELAINQKTAKALGLTVPATLLARADEVIE